MAGRSAIHDTFRIERSYAAAPATVFAAFSTEEARSSWGETDEVELPDGNDGGDTEFDFRAGGRERFTVQNEETTYRYDAQYYDIVPDSRIVYCYEMYADGKWISVSVATIEFADSGGATQLIWTEQGVYLDGHNGADDPAMRKAGTVDMLGGLTAYLRRQDAAPGGQP
jgi:uncharacterized protein YndB with AHSA1/START domain